jgi:peroxiredoxin
MNIGDKLPDFKLQSTSDEYLSNYDFADKYSLLLVVTCNHCKYSRAYWHRLIKLMAKFEEDSMGMAAICGNDENQYPQDSFNNMKSLAKELHLPFPYLHDPTQKMLLTLGAIKTPEVFLFNSQRELVYKGAIDDNWENEHAVMLAHLDDAIEYCLDGLEVDYPEIPAVGCSVKWLPENMPAAQ